MGSIEVNTRDNPPALVEATVRLAPLALWMSMFLPFLCVHRRAAIGPSAPARSPSRAWAWIAATLLCSLLPHTAHADEPLWELGLGVGALQLPHYRGSDQRYNLVLPVPYAVYRGRILRATREGARAVLLDREGFDFDVSVAASPPTRSEDNNARRGMQDLAPTLEFGPNANVRLAQGARWKLDLRLPLRAVFSVERRPEALGWTFNPVLNVDWELSAGPASSGWRLGAQAGPVWATRRFHAHYYDVSAADATAARSAYSAGSGYGGWRWTVGSSRRVGAWWLGAFVRGDSVAGSTFVNSPLVRQRHNVSVGVAFSRVFAVSDERVAVVD